jgi:hypothetical protein
MEKFDRIAWECNGMVFTGTVVFVGTSGECYFVKVDSRHVYTSKYATIWKKDLKKLNARPLL